MGGVWVTMGPGQGSLGDKGTVTGMGHLAGS